MLDPKTKERIRIEAIKQYPNYKGASTQENLIQDWKQQAYAAGAEAEAERAQGLISVLQSIDEDADDILLVYPTNIPAKYIKKRIVEALTNYNNQVNK